MKVQAAFKAGQPVAVHIVRWPSISGHHGQPERSYLAGRLPTD